MTYRQLWHSLLPLYDEHEAQAIAREVFEVGFGLTLVDIMMGKDTHLTTDDQEKLTEIARRLQSSEPVQYVLGEAFFCGRSFAVDGSVLIPRPETEELCRWIVAHYDALRRAETSDNTRGENDATRGNRDATRGERHNSRVATGSQSRSCKEASGRPKILDVGTGSGCIAITLAKELVCASVAACDISAEALATARRNALRHAAEVSFFQADILQPSLAIDVAPLEAIVSNPPYIARKEQALMEQNVLRYEPHGALFVPDDDPLLFYRAIAAAGQRWLKTGGQVFVEINPLYTSDTAQLFSSMGYSNVETRHDDYGKQRMIRAER